MQRRFMWSVHKFCVLWSVLLRIIASLLINVFEDNSIECERQGRYDKIICKLRKQKKKRVYISKKENIDYFIMIKALAKSTHFQ